MHCFHRIFKFGLQSLNIFSSKYLKLFGNEMNCKDVQFLNIYKKYLQLETFQLSNALMACKDSQYLLVFLNDGNLREFKKLEDILKNRYPCIFLYASV